MFRFWLVVVVLALPPWARGEEYYLSAEGGDDSYDGMSPAYAGGSNGPWQSIARANTETFFGGDTIHFEAGGVWRETLVVGSSGTPGSPVTYTSYGSGDKPLVLLTDPVDAWEEWDAQHHIWRAPVGTDWVYDCMDGTGDERAPYYAYWHADPSTWSDGWFCGTRSDGYVYIRSDGGDPGPREVGARRYGVEIGSHDHITIDGLAIKGPPGNTGERVNALSRGGIFTSGRHTTIVNCDVEHVCGSCILGRTSDLNDFTASDNRLYGCSFGFYFLQTGDNITISRNRIVHTAATKQDSGDRDAIGFNLTGGGTGENILIEQNYIEDQGSSAIDLNGGLADAAITLAKGSSATIRYNYVRDVHGVGCIIHSDANHKVSRIYGNICDQVRGDPHGLEDVAFRGIHVGNLGVSPPVHETEAEVFNNLIINGRGTAYQSAAILLSASNDSTFTKIHVSNNIFHNNDFTYELRYSPIGDLSTNDPVGFQVKGNIFHHSDPETIINHNGWYFDANGERDIDPGTLYNDHRPGIAGNVFNTTASPLADHAGGVFSLVSGSYAIDAGVDLGSPFDWALDPITSWDPLDVVLALQADHGSGWEIGPYVFREGGNLAPTGIIEAPAQDATIVAGESVTFMGGYSDPDGDVCTGFFWDFGGGATNVTDEDPGAIVFDNPGRYTVTFTVTDPGGLPDPDPPSVVITVEEAGDECSSGFEDCNGNPADGCEVDTSSDSQNCGSCGAVCDLAFATAVCNLGECLVAQCEAGHLDCNDIDADGCEQPGSEGDCDGEASGGCGCMATSGHPTGPLLLLSLIFLIAIRRGGTTSSRSAAPGPR